jgi:AGZA family xanthine/uracil permease-like MFS transporter
LTALPAGIAAGSFFAWLYAIFMPVFFETNDAIFAWKVTLHANLLYGMMFVVCGFIIKFLMKHIPMEAMLGSVVGGSIAYLLMTSMADGFAHPQIQIPALFLLLFFQFGKIKTKKL